MKLLPFNTEIRQRLIQRGYKHIEIKYQIEGEFSWLADDKKLQILKAVDHPDTPHTEYINSERIDALLNSKDINSYIIVPIPDEL